MATTVDDLIDLKDSACSVAYSAAALLDDEFMARYLKAIDPEHGSNDDEHDLLLEIVDDVRTLKGSAQDVVDRAELYDGADEDDGAVSIEDHETRQLAEKVQQEGWPSVADDIREGVPIATVVSRLREFHGEADEIIALLEGGA